MPIDNPPPPPPPPAKVERQRKAASGPIADMRDAFARNMPQTQQDRADAEAFIDGKIEMIRRDEHMTKAQKAAAIADLESRRQADPAKPKDKPQK
jgi:hypothetical protein